MRGISRWFACCTILALLAALAGCKEQLQSRVSERDANEMLAALYSAGIRATKLARDEKNWAVEVEGEDLQRALVVLREHGLPREQFANTGDLFKKEGLVSTPAEERIRFMYAISQELSRTLSEIDGVITARVHLVMPANDPLATRVRPSSASVFIKHRSNANLQALSPAIKNLVMRGIEGLEYENISMTFIAGEEPVRIAPTSAAAPAVAAPIESAPTPVAGFALAATLVLVAAGGLGFLWGRRSASSSAAEPPESESASADAASPPSQTRAFSADAAGARGGRRSPWLARLGFGWKRAAGDDSARPSAQPFTAAPRDEASYAADLPARPKTA